MAEPTEWAAGTAVGRGYLHLAGRVEPTLGRTPLPRRSSAKTALLEELTVLARRVAAGPTGARAAVFTARLVTPGFGATTAPPGAVGGYDVAVLIDVDDPGGVERLPADRAVRAMIDLIAAASEEHLVMPARCRRSIADVDRSRPGLFLFNYFTGPDPATTLQAWRQVAGWYQDHTGLDNSVLLAPTSPVPVTLVNHARWDIGLFRLAARQFRHPRFRRDIVTVLRDAGVRARPTFFDLVDTTTVDGTVGAPAGSAR